MAGFAPAERNGRMLRRFAFVCLCALFALAANAANPKPPAAAIASAHPAATEAGFLILEQGGNAFDAAVAVSAALAVVEPYSSGIGGGGFWLLHRANDGYQVMLDGRETAPAAAHRDLYLDETGKPQKHKSIDGPLAAGIPGLPAGLVHLSRQYGRLPLAQTLAPAIELAEQGFDVETHYQRLAEFRKSALNASPAASAVFLKDGQVPPVGERIVQPDLAQTLRRLAQQGFDGFYKGPLAQRLVAGVRAAGGIWTEQDLADYQVKERPPMVGHYRGIRVVSAPPPSSGGVVLTQALNVLSGFDLPSLKPADRIHLVVEAMRWAYRDRALYLGDTDFVNVPVQRLTSPDYAAQARHEIRIDAASKLCDSFGQVLQKGADTTHFSILDREGNRVAATLSINYPFGSGFMPPGTGVLLNDEMDDFSMHPGVPNAYGLVGRAANAIEPGKRMLSSMTPTFLESGDRVAILGTPGGSRIISMVLLAILDFEQGHRPRHWVGLPRYHHQCAPNWIQHEPDTFSAEHIQALEQKGHRLKAVNRQYGNMQAILWDQSKNELKAASDPRGLGVADVR